MSQTEQRQPAEELLQLREDLNDVIANHDGQGEYLADIIERHLNRRDLLKGGLAAAAVTLMAPLVGEAGVAEAAESSLNFSAIPPSAPTTDAITLAAGHHADVVIRWGDPVIADAPPFDPMNQTAAAQARQFGYNCDFAAFLPLPLGSQNSDRGLLWVNHEYTNPELMFTGYDANNPTKQQVDVELQAHGASIVEIRRTSGRWSVVQGSPYNRRITATTPMRFTGHAAGSDWLKTSADPAGTRVLGTLNNCGGGVTPWGTVLTAEENHHQYFGNWNALPSEDPRKGVHRRYSLPGAASERKWERFYERFDVAKEPNEVNRFGWMVEVDPYDPSFVPRKRTGLGRFFHEAASIVLSRNGRAVVYTGDDARFEYVYKFVSGGRYNASDREANMNLFDEGTLYAAKFNEDGSGEWLPLVLGSGPLNESNNFYLQSDVLVHTRRAADLIGATKMDRPEDIDTNPVNGKVYMAFTNNTLRGTAGQAGPDAANPRASNRHGHIIEMTLTNNDHGSLTFSWSIFLLCGDPADNSTYFGGYPKAQISPISSPDNVIFDREGNLWICTDGMPGALSATDGMYAVPVEGSERGHLRRLLGAVAGCEVASAIFTPDDTSLFISIQDPGEGGTWEQPISTWPDGGTPVRPSMVVVQNDTSRSRVGVVGQASVGALGTMAAAAAGALIA